MMFLLYQMLSRVDLVDRRRDRESACHKKIVRCPADMYFLRRRRTAQSRRYRKAKKARSGAAKPQPATKRSQRPWRIEDQRKVLNATVGVCCRPFRCILLISHLVVVPIVLMDYVNKFGEKTTSKPLPDLPEHIFKSNNDNGWIILSEDRYLIAAIFPRFLKTGAHVSLNACDRLAETRLKLFIVELCLRRYDDAWQGRRHENWHRRRQQSTE